MKQQKEKGLVGYMEHCKKQGGEKRLFPSMDDMVKGGKKSKR